MSLPVPNLDDRRFQDIVDEAKRMIPRLCPEWTNHNVSDPGVALIELFAWMTDLTLYRLNQVPERQYTQFLNLLGVAPFPSRPAQADLTFWLSAAPDEPVLVPAGTEIAVRAGGSAAEDAVNPDESDQLIFSTLDDLVVDQPALVAALTGHGEDARRDVLAELRYDRDAVTCFPSEPLAPDDALYLGFDRPLAGQAIELAITTAASGVGIDPTDPPLAWECWTGEYWVPCGIHADDTGGLNRDGSVLLMIPRRHEPLILGGQRRWWLRARLTPARPGQAMYRTSPQVASIEVGCLGGTVRAEHAETISGELLGRATGHPGESFRLNHRPVLPRRGGEVVVVSEASGPGVPPESVAGREWVEVPDFSRSGPHDRHVVWDEAMGVIRFGPAIRQPDGRVHQHGAIPPAGAVVTVRSYRTGGGARGNVGAGTITALRVGIPYVDRVENLAAATGGVDPETPENVKARGPMTLRTGQRAVTVSDFERLSLESTTEVARARCIAPDRAGDPVRVLLVPRVTAAADALTIDDFALSESLFRTVSGYLDERRTLGSVVELVTPYYVGVSVAVLVRAATGRPPTLVRQRVLDKLYRIMHPVTGGPDGAGWPWDAPLTSAALLSLVGSVDGVAAVDELVMFEVDLRNGVRLGDAVDVLPLDHRSLLLGAKHRVVVR